METLIAIGAFVLGYKLSKKVELGDNPEELKKNIQTLRYNLTKMVKDELEELRQKDKERFNS